MNYDKKQALNIIINAAKEYQDKLLDKHFLIIYKQGNEYNSACIGFRKNNFLHLTGIETVLSAPLFFERIINGKLSVTDFELDNKGKACQKLDVLPCLSQLLYNNCMIGYFVNNGIYISADYFVGNTRATLSVGFRLGKKADFPVSLYKEDVKILTNPTYRVVAILSKKYNETVYSTYAFLAKGIDIQALHLSDDIRNVIDFDNLNLDS